MIDKKQIKIAVASGKGGTGKTFVSTNLFKSLQEVTTVSLVDCDAEAPDSKLFFKVQLKEKNEVYQNIPVINKEQCTFCGKCHDWCNYNAIFILPEQKVIQVIEDLCHDCGACVAACNFNAISEKKIIIGKVTEFVVDQFSFIEGKMNTGVMSPVKIIKGAVQKINPDDEVVIFDAPPGTSCPFIQTVASADFTILVTEPTPFGLSDLKQSAYTLRVLNKKFGVIINKAGIGDNNVCHFLEEESIPLLLEIPFDTNIYKQYSQGILYSDNAPGFKTQLQKLYFQIKDLTWK